MLDLLGMAMYTECIDNSVMVFHFTMSVLYNCQRAYSSHKAYIIVSGIKTIAYCIAFIQWAVQKQEPTVVV